jgi:hypothetical protein
MTLSRLQQMRPVALCFALLSVTPVVYAQTFEAFRLRSGMTPDQVQKAVPGYKVRWGQMPGSAFLVNGDDIYASLAFCNSQLVSVIRSIDADTDFLTYLQERLTEYGQPRVAVKKDAWTGAGGGDITSVTFNWIKDGVGNTLSLAPEGRNGSGDLRHTRYASLHVFLENSPCARK